VVTEIAIPAWAKTIRVETRRSKLIVVGEGRIDDPVAFASDPRLRATDELGSYVPLMGDGREGNDCPHLEFANASDFEKQVAFVKKYGPIQGVVQKKGPPLRVEQDLADLQRKQRVFARAAKVVAEIRENLQKKRTKKQRMQSAERLGRLAFDLETDADLPAPDDRHAAMLNAVMKKEGISKTFEAMVDEFTEDYEGLDNTDRQIEHHFFEYSAHWMLGRLLNLYQPSVTFFYGRAAELPDHRPEGILPILYFMLRRDYLGMSRSVASCSNNRCGKLFASVRVRQRFCCVDCSKSQRDREYWERAGKKKRRERARKG
jgi:hypothetical protein